MPYAKRDGVSLHYEHAGHGDPPVVFLHGWCCDYTFFQPRFDHFRASHAVAALDPRRCGSSDRPENGYDIPTLADDVAWLCHDAGIAGPVVVGLSLGGMIAIGLAAQLEGPDGEAVRWAFVQGLFLATDDADRKRRILEIMCSVPLSVAAKVIRGVVTWNGVGALSLCHAPLLVLLTQPWGSNDPARLLALRPDLQIGVTVGTGHFHQLEAPEQVTPMIDRFVQVAIAAPPV